MNPNRVIYIISIAVITAFIGQGVVIPLLPIYARDLGASGLEIGFIFGSFSITQMIFLPIVGKMSDRRGRKAFLCIGLFGYFVTSLSYLYADSVPTLILTRLFQGACSSMILPITQAYVGEISPKGQEGKFQGILNIALLIGLAGGPMLGGITKDQFGYDAAITALGVVCLVGFCLCVLLLPPSREEKSMMTHRTSVSFQALLSDINLIAALLCRFASMMCLGTIWMFMSLLVDQRFGLSSTVTGLLLATLVLMGAISSPFGGYLSDRKDKRLITHIGLTITATMAALLAFTANIWFFWGLIIVLGIANGIAMTSINAMATMIGKKMHAMGAVMSFMFLGQSLAMSIGPVMSGILMDILNLKIALLIEALILIVSILGFFKMTTGYRQLEKTVNEGLKN